MKKRMTIMLVSLGILFGLIFGYHAITGYLFASFMAKNVPVVTVSTMKVDVEPWQPQLDASGSIRAILGVNVTTELAGMVQTIFFTPGAMVKKGDLLVQLNIDPDVAQLHSLEANAELAKVTYHRDQAQFAVKAISKATLDTDVANLHSTAAQVQQQQAIIAQKTIRAPFSGRVGICLVNPGQYLAPGDKVTMLQTIDPIYVDFYIPQQYVDQIKTGQTVAITVDNVPNNKFIGKITTIDPGLDPNVRNVEVEATIANSKLLLAPGMYAAVTINSGKPSDYLTVPQSAVSFNPYGQIIYIIEQQGKDKQGKPILAAHQRFVTTGKKRGDQITVLDGLKKGDLIVTSGQLKLKNGSIVAINNSIAPTNDPAPMPADE